MYQLVVTPSAKKSIKRLSRDAQQEIQTATKILTTEPQRGRRLHGSLSFLYSFHFKFKNTHYRVAYSLNNKQQLVIIHLVGPRENFYNRLRRLL